MRFFIVHSLFLILVLIAFFSSLFLFSFDHGRSGSCGRGRCNRCSSGRRSCIRGRCGRCSSKRRGHGSRVSCGRGRCGCCSSGRRVRSFFSLFVLVLLFLFSSFFSFSVYVFLEPLSTQVSAARPPALRPQAGGRRWLSAGGSGGSSPVAVGAESPRPSTVRPSAAVRPPSTAVVGQQWCEREEVAFKTAAGTAGRDGCRPQYGRLRP